MDHPPSFSSFAKYFLHHKHFSLPTGRYRSLIPPCFQKLSSISNATHKYDHTYLVTIVFDKQWWWTSPPPPSLPLPFLQLPLRPLFPPTRSLQRHRKLPPKQQRPSPRRPKHPRVATACRCLFLTVRTLWHGIIHNRIWRQWTCHPWTRRNIHIFRLQQCIGQLWLFRGRWNWYYAFSADGDLNPDGTIAECLYEACYDEECQPECCCANSIIFNVDDWGSGKLYYLWMMPST